MAFRKFIRQTDTDPSSLPGLGGGLEPQNPKGEVSGVRTTVRGQIGSVKSSRPNPLLQSPKVSK